MWTEADLRRWTSEVPQWVEAYEERIRQGEVKTELVEWLSSLPWTHLYHQTFKSEITDGKSSLSVASRFLAEYASRSGTTAALLVAERHPNRKSKTQPANSLTWESSSESMQYFLNRRRPSRTFAPVSGSSKRRSARSADSAARASSGRGETSTSFEGKAGRLYHVHGLLAGPSVRKESLMRIAGVTPYWQMVKEWAWNSLGAARVWQITTTREAAATVYAMKYILKGMRDWPETALTARTRARWELTPPSDDWTIVEFPYAA